MPRSVFFAVLPLLLLCGCMVKTNKENLQEALHHYNTAVRWGRTEWMAEHVPEDKRSAMLSRRTEFGELQITGCEVGEVQVKGKDQALALVRLDWYLVSRPRLNTSFIEQTWKRSGDKWLITRQRLVRGAPCPLIVPIPSQDRFRQQELWPTISS